MQLGLAVWIKQVRMCFGSTNHFVEPLILINRNLHRPSDFEPFIGVRRLGSETPDGCESDQNINMFWYTVLLLIKTYLYPAQSYHAFLSFPIRSYLFLFVPSIPEQRVDHPLLCHPGPCGTVV